MNKKIILSRIKKDTSNGCWEWTKCPSPQGYGQIWIDGKVYKAHRASWIIFRGPIPEKLFVCHKCDVRLCVNPEHLFLGTNTDNVRDCYRKGRLKLPPGSGKLSPDDVVKIRKLYSNGILGYRKLGKMFSVRRSTIQSIVKGKIWAVIKLKGVKTK